MSSYATFPSAGQEYIKNDTGIKLIEECCPGKIIRRKFKRNTNYSVYGESGFSGSIAITDQRILLFGIYGLEFHIPFNHDNIDQLEYKTTKTGGNILSIRFDWNTFHPLDIGTHGNIEYRLKTPRSQEIVHRIQSNIASSRRKQ